jgi:hypothetical protein
VGNIPQNQYKFVYYHFLKTDIVGELTNLINELEIDFPSSKMLSNMLYLLKRAQKKTDKYTSNHIHSVESCCGMTKIELQRLLSDIYELHKALQTQQLRGSLDGLLQDFSK